VTPNLRTALKALALANPAGTPINLTLVREDLLALVNGGGEPQAPPVPEDRLLTVPEAARRLALPARYVYTHADRPPFKGFVVRVGRKVLVSEARLARWLERAA
jgi:excisionase family DNA binding protein